MINISIIGSGNVANHLAQAFFENKLPIEYIIARNEPEGRTLAKQVKATFVSTHQPIVFHQTNMVIIAVKDDAIEEMGNVLKEVNIPVVHTSGTKSSTLLKDICIKTGVFYPLQTFTKGKNMDFRNIPIIIDSPDVALVTFLKDMASKISDKVVQLTDMERQKMHIAAVFSNNFVNHLWLLAENYCHENDLDFNLLLPLIEETAEKLKTMSPFHAQTGPARRHDLKTIAAHLHLLDVHEMLRTIYKIMSDSIEQNY
ncbi:MAG: DUF2520 domain-containing protein [Chitinophagales bacterium]|nr:DUF2520 domain-containing protein [Chitinophagales bacterium]